MRFGLKTIHIAWPSSDQMVRDALSASTVVKAMYLSENVLFSLLDLRPLAKRLYTTIIHLESSLDELMRQMDPKSCRYEIRKSDKLDFNHHINEFHDEAYALFNHFFKSNGYREAITKEEWEGYSRITDLHTIWHDNTLIAAHLILRNPPNRVRLLLSATADRKNQLLRDFISPLNRRLHWCEIMGYKKSGYLEYDFGGAVTDPNDPRYPNSKFKSSFGGVLTTEYSIFIIGNKPARMVFNFAVQILIWLGIRDKVLRSWFPALQFANEQNQS